LRLAAQLCLTAGLVGALPHAASADNPPARARGPLEVVVDKAKVSLTEHHLELRASRSLVKVTIHVVGDSGNTLADETRELNSYAPGSPLIVTWTPSSDETVARIEVSAYDADGYWKTIAITPWAVVIPHEEVNFRTDSSQIDASEAPKLEASYLRVAEALNNHPQIRPRVTLFVAGHTDTVGDSGYNLGLSRRRAQSLARWFRQRGLRIPIAFEGFGEYALLVKTADEVDEPRNRRADYILSVDEPQLHQGSSGFRPAWSRVP
jgi:outer membrane protein OmpA-like peptidoglycan-associated protein